MTTYFGGANALSGGTLTLTTRSGYSFYYFQNTASNPMTLTFQDGAAATLGDLNLNPASAAGRAGQYVDSVSFPMFLDAVTVLVTGTGSDTFRSGASKQAPTRMFNIDTRGPTGR